MAWQRAPAGKHGGARGGSRNNRRTTRRTSGRASKGPGGCCFRGRRRRARDREQLQPSRRSGDGKLRGGHRTLTAAECTKPKWRCANQGRRCARYFLPLLPPSHEKIQPVATLSFCQFAAENSRLLRVNVQGLKRFSHLWKTAR